MLETPIKNENQVTQHPWLIQGGMGIAVSNWRLAKAVSMTGHLGVVSGTAINSVLVRKLQDGDLDSNYRRALAAFPNQDLAKKIIELYFIEGGKPKNQPYKLAPLFALKSPKALLQLTVAANFCEVFLAKEGHTGAVGINLLEKVQLPNLASLYGAMLAGVDYVIMGAGIPREIPGALDLLSKNQKAILKIPVAGSASGQEFVTEFDPHEVMESTELKQLHRPYFFPIVSSAVLAASLAKKSTGRIDGFIVESPLAGGHNAPPRGPLNLNEAGEPIYGPRDEVKFEDMKALGLPFWFAGSYATPEKLREVLANGGSGIQVGTLFAFSEESGLDPSLRTQVTRALLNDDPKNWIFTDPVSSPTGFPFKAVRLDNSLSEKETYLSRSRICDLGYLRHAYLNGDKVGMRCPAEPVDQYIKKGGTEEETKGRKCLCNALMADIGMPQVTKSQSLELPLLTAGDDLNQIHRLMKNSNKYSALDVIAYLEKGLTLTAVPRTESVSEVTEAAHL